MGGKSYIAEWIVSKFPPHKTYVEVFGGGASVLFAKPRSPVEVYNDKWGDIVNLFLVLRDKPLELKRFLTYTPFSHQLFDEYREKFRKRDFRDDVERAGIIFFLLWASKNADLVDCEWLAQRRRNLALAMKNTVDKLEVFAERLRGVIIENMDFEEVIRRYDGEDTLFYCDPPYPVRDQYYLYDFCYRDHYRLAKVLSSIKGKAAVSYYSDPRIEELYPRDRWRYLEIRVPKACRICMDGESRPQAIEWLLLNYEPPKTPAFKRVMSLREVFG
jgi:DNA adenine methylase